MKYLEGLVEFNDLNTAFSLINSLQVGDSDKNHYLFVLSHRDFRLPTGNKGSLLMLAILWQKFVAAEWLINNMSIIDEFDDIATAINIASESTDYERKIEKLSEEAASNDTYQKILEELENNQRALNRLKERYLGKQKTNK
jgi:hypothetical protein